MWVVFFVVLANAIDENELLKEIFPQGLPAKTAKPKPTSTEKMKNRVYQSGYKSEIDLDCLQQHYDKAVFQIKVNHLNQWLNKCRQHPSKDCRIDSSQIDQSCLAKVESYYLFIPNSGELSQLKKGCSVHQMSCPKPDKE